MTENQMLSDRILIAPIFDTVSPGGIIMPGDKACKKGKVILVGPGKKDVEMVVKPNDIVLFSEYSGFKFSIDRNEYLIMTQEDVLMIINKQNNII